jgi:hypothetical protein
LLSHSPTTAWWAGLKIRVHALAVALAVLSAVLFVIGLFAVKHADNAVKAKLERDLD